MRVRKRQFLALARRCLLALALASFAQPALSVDPQYQPQMQRLLQLIGSLYFLQPLCGFNQQDWRLHAAELIDLDQPSDDRRQRLIGSFNEGYEVYARLYRDCTEAAREAQSRLLSEADELSRDIHSRFAD